MARDYGRYDDYGNAKKGWTVSISLGKVLLFLALWCYPANWMLMRHGVACYNNDPTHEWQGMTPSVQHGPSPVLRTLSFVVSPVAVPVNLVYWAMEASIPKQ